MRILITMLALTRLMMLKRQWRAVAARLAELPESGRMLLAAFVYGEAQRAAKHPLPQFYGSSTVGTYRPWGDAVEVAFARIGSSNQQIRAKAIATWLAVVFHETRNAEQPGLQALHQDVGEHFTQLRDLHQRVLAIRMAA
jgi:hypothetical protein